MSEIEVHALESCTATLDKSMLVQMTGIGEEVTIPIPFYVIDHPEGVALVDTGQSYELLQDPENYGPNGAPLLVDWAPMFEMSEDQKTIHQLEDLGYARREIDIVVQSHLHMDHAGGIDEFPNAEFVVQRKELEYASSPDPVQKGFYQEGDFGALRTPEFEVNAADGRVDLFGDGRVVTIPTPGHSPGHQSVKIDLDGENTVILAMDLSHQREGYENMLGTSFDWSVAEGNKSRRKIKNMARDENTEVYINHDGGDFDRITSR